MTNKVTPKQKKFCQEYLIDLNATQAAIRAGYKKDYADRMAHKLVENSRVKKYIKECMAERAKELKLDANWVLQRFKDISDRCMQAEPVLDREGKPTGEYRFDAAGANKSTEMIGKHLGMFTDKIEYSGNITVRKLEDFF